MLFDEIEFVMSSIQLQLKEFKSLDEFRNWWESPEVVQARQTQPGEITSISKHPYVEPWLKQIEKTTYYPQPAGKVFGKYQIEKKLGQGGMGVVYLALDTESSQKVALKIMLLKGDMAIERFNREAKAASKLQHSNIIRVYEVGKIDKYHYLTMDYVNGPSLEQVANKNNKELSQDRIAEIIRDIALALHYAHSQGIVHRDIKPSNILLDSAGNAYLTDFGLAKETTESERSLTVTGTIMGTPDYMSPEQAKGDKHKINRRSDVFSLGSTLYFTLTGVSPFKGKELYQTLIQVVNKDPIAPRKLVQATHPDLEAVCLKCLEKKQEDRYQTAEDMAIDLDKYLKNERVSAKAGGSLAVIYKKNKTVVTAAVVSAAVLIIIGIIMMINSSVKTSQAISDYHLKGRNSFEREKYEEARDLYKKILALLPGDAKAKDMLHKCDTAIKKRGEQANLTQKTEADVKEKERLAQEIRNKAKEVLGGALLASTPDDKIRIASDAVKIDGSFGDAYQVMGYAYKEKRNYKRAVDCFTKAIENSPDLESSYYERGYITAFIDKKAAEAVADMEKVVKINPNSHMAWFAKAVIAFTEANYDKTIDCFARALREKINYAEAYYALGYVYQEKDDSCNAIEKYLEAVKYKSDFVEAYLALARAYSKGMDWDNAVTNYSRVITFIPDHIEAHLLRGDAYYNKKEPEKAIQDYSRAIELAPNNEEGYKKRVRAYLDKGDVESVLGDFNRLIEINPGSRDVYLLRGGIYCERNEFDRAIADFNKALELKSDDAEVYCKLGDAYRGKRNLAQAVESYRKAISVDANCFNAYAARGGIYYEQKEFDSAINDFDNALNLKKEAEIYFMRGNVHLRKKDREKAMSDYNSAIAQDPTHTLAYLNRANIFYEKDDLNNAYADYSKVVELNPECIAAHLKLGNIFYKRGNMNGAIKYFNSVIRLKPDSVEGYLNRGYAYAKMGNRDQAIFNFGMALRLDPNNAEAKKHLQYWEKQ
jgi:serine/threonine protein kinase/Tfp pilus assembly protein PilF